MTIHTNAPEVIELARKAFPDHRCRRYSVEVFAGPISLASYWSGGSRDYWKIVSMTTNDSINVPENGTPFSAPQQVLNALPPNAALVCWHRGAHEDVTVYVNADSMNRLALPAPIDLTPAERVVLIATRSYKSSYAGRKNNRLYEAQHYTGITEQAWDAAKATCTAKGLLNKAGAITDAGRNAVGNANLYSINKAELSK